MWADRKISRDVEGEVGVEINFRLNFFIYRNRSIVIWGCFTFTFEIKTHICARIFEIDIMYTKLTKSFLKCN